MKIDIFAFHQKADKSSEEIKNDIKETKKRLEQARSRFQYERDSDLVDSCIFEINSLQAKYNYLLKRTRAM